MPKQRIPLLASPIERTLAVSTATDQKFINCFPEITRNAITGKATAFIMKRPGTIGTNSAPASYVGLPGGVVWSGFSSGAKGAFCYLNGTTLRVYDTTRTIIDAAVPAKTTGFSGFTRLAETNISGTAYLTLLAKESADNTINGFYLAEGGSWTRITDANFPANLGFTIVGNFVHMDGYAFVMTSNGRVWNTDLNSATFASTTSAQYTTAQVYPDGGRGLARIKNTILAFGSHSVEFFQNTGNATGSPLTRIASATVKVGALDGAVYGGETIKTIGDNVYFVGINADSGAIGFYQVDGFTVKKISTPAIDRYLQFTQLNSVTAGIAGAMVLHGMTHIVLGVVITSTVAIPCYCVDTGMWWFMTVAGNSAQSQSNVLSCFGLNGESYFVTNSNANSQGRKQFVTAHNTLGYTDDDSTAYTHSMQTLPIDHGTRAKKFYKSIEIVGDIRASSANTGISWSDDDYQTFSTPRNVDLSVLPPIRPRLTRLGAAHRRAWKVEETTTIGFRAEALDIEFEVGR